MDLYPPAAKGNPNEIDPRHTGTAGQRCDAASLAWIHRIDGIARAGDGAHLDGDALGTIASYEIDLAFGEHQIALFDDQTAFSQPARRDRLADRAYGDAAIGQSLSSVLSSFSTFTSRNVSTWTLSRKRAGRNMSQTQASVMVTSK